MQERYVLTPEEVNDGYLPSLVADDTPNRILQTRWPFAAAPVAAAIQANHVLWTAACDIIPPDIVCNG